jgi:protein-S-isoprenylcysteine O-methyltransferase Ste14
MGQDTKFRLMFIGLFVLALFISAYYRRLARKSGEVISRRQEGMPALILRAVLAFPLLLSIILYAINPRWIQWSEAPLPTWIRWSGAGIGVFCILLLRWVLRSIGGNISETVLTKRDHKLVREGPYRRVRHPLYGVGLLLILSLSLIASNWFMILLWIMGVLVFRHVVIPIEEEKLIEAFGEEYEAYREGTGALVPRIR